MNNSIDTDRFSQTLRERSIKVDARTLLVSNLRGTEQENDLTEPSNCQGYGRIRHFRRETSAGWPSNPLPIDPASKSLGIPAADLLRAQVFQNASCNWRCWYCYVPFSLLSANTSLSGWLSAPDLLDLYLQESSRPKVIDLSGGQPDLVPEWVPWMMQELIDRGLEREIYLWSDDNLSNDYFWQFLSERDRELVHSYRNYGKVACFKGFTEESFAFNTCAAPALFDRQFELMHRYVESGIDVYGYVTFTTPKREGIRDNMARFMDRLQLTDPNLPLRVVPLEIKTFDLMKSRMTELHHQALVHQQVAVEVWQDELLKRFSGLERSCSIADVPLGRRSMTIS